jgi:hypothetical protein
MKIVHILRKPLSEGTVADNVLKHGCGGLNIDATRISYEAGHEPPKDANVDKPSSWEGETYNGDQPYILNSKLKTRQVYTASGRFPANLILQHLEGCRCEGVKRVRRDIRDATGAGAGVQVNDHKGGGQWKSSGRAVGSTTETIANWVCVEGCPVRALDVQSGFADTGGASRFFKQAKDIHDLIEYLDDLIRPAEKPARLIWTNPEETLQWEGIKDATAHGAILSSATLDDEVFRILKPGGHLLLMGAPQDFKTICRMEDLGFEVRDSICVLDSAEDKFHYVPKAGKTEKEGGCWGLEPDQQDPSRSEDKVGGNRPHNRGARKRQNSHPTVKPVAVMEALLSGVSKKAPVVDPFMGSGTTMIACLKTGHNGIGIELNPDYLKIADARVRHWDHTHNGWVSTKIDSDAEPANAEEEGEVSLSDFFRIG